jgi:hypothetical protein
VERAAEIGDELLRYRARVVVLAFVATLALGVLLVIAFEPEVQTVDAGELAARSRDARAFLIADYVFIALYALVSPLAQLRFGRALAAAGSAPRWITWTAVLLLSAGVVDATENTLLLSATDSEAPGTVDFAHALAVPKIVLFVTAALLSLRVVAKAAQAAFIVRR